MPRGEGAGRGQGNNSRRRGGGYPQELKKPLCPITKLSQSLGNNYLALSLSILSHHPAPYGIYCHLIDPSGMLLSVW